MNRILIVILIISSASLLASFFCSLLEACLYSVTRSQIETLRSKGNRGGAILARARTHIDDAIAAILIVNTVANVMGAAWASALVRSYYGDTALSVFSGILTLAILFFGEITPKSLGVRYAPILAPVLAYPLRMMMWSLWPVIRACSMLTRLWGRNAHISHGTQEDIISLTRLIENQGGELHPYEAAWVANALRLDEVTAFDLMTPNPVVARVPATMTLRGTRVDADHWRYSRLPVCADDNPDRIVGVVRRRRVFDALARDLYDKKMSDLMDEVVFVSETTAAHQLLDDFIKRRRHLFCVQNERGFFVGVVTLEDVLECLLGREIVDETDLHEDMQVVARHRKEALLARQKPDEQ